MFRYHFIIVAIIILAPSLYLDVYADEVKRSTDGDTSYETFYDANQVFLKQSQTTVKDGVTRIRTIDSTGALVERSISSRKESFGLNEFKQITLISRYTPGSQLASETVSLLERKRSLPLGKEQLLTQEKVIHSYDIGPPRRLAGKTTEHKVFSGLNSREEPVYETVSIQDDGFSNSGEECDYLKGRLRLKQAEFLRVKSERDELVRDADRLMWQVREASDWMGLPKHGADLWLDDAACDRCDSLPMEAIQKFHEWACIEGQGEHIHPEPLPMAVEQYRFIYELKLKARPGFSCENGAMTAFGKALYTDWALRDDFLESNRRLMAHAEDAAAGLDEQLDILTKDIAGLREALKDSECATAPRLPPLGLVGENVGGPDRAPAAEHSKECAAGDMVGHVNCVTETMGD